MNYITILIIGCVILITIFLILSFISKWRNPKTTPLFQDNRDLDTSILTLGAVILSFTIVVLLFISHWRVDGNEKPVLTEAIIMAIISIPTHFITYALGKKNGENESKQSDKRIEKIEKYLQGDDDG